MFSLGVVAATDKVYTYTDSVGNAITLFVTPCTNSKVLSFIPDEHKDKFNTATARLDGVTLNACWALTTDQSTVFFVFEDGEQAGVPTYVFQTAHRTGA
mgnify:FL=1